MCVLNLLFFEYTHVPYRVLYLAHAWRSLKQSTKPNIIKRKSQRLLWLLWIRYDRGFEGIPKESADWRVRDSRVHTVTSPDSGVLVFPPISRGTRSRERSRPTSGATVHKTRLRQHASVVIPESSKKPPGQNALFPTLTHHVTVTAKRSL